MIGTTNKALGALLLMATLITGSGQPLPKQDSDYTPARQSQVVSWQLKRLAPPSSVYVTVDDVLRASAASSIGSEVVTISYRLLRASDGAVVYGQFTVSPPATRSLAFAEQPMAEGFLLSISCQASQAFTRGQTFVRIFLNPKALGAGQPGFMLMSDYVTTAMAPGHPNGRILAPTEGPGWIRVVSQANPAAGADFSINPPANSRWRVQSFAGIYTTSAAAANRQVRIAVTSPLTGTLWMSSANFTHTASQAVFYSIGSGAAVTTPPAVSVDLAFPNGLYITGRDQDNLVSAVASKDVADQWSQLLIFVEDWLENV